MTSILIIEDSVYQRGLLKHVLEKENFIVFEAANGLEGLNKFKTHSPDLILLDLNMPEVNGWELLDKLTDKAKIIVFSADIQESSRKKCAEKGVRAFLNKPLNTGELLSTITKILQEN